MNKKIILLTLIVMFSTITLASPFVYDKIKATTSEYGYYKINNCVLLNQVVSNVTYVNLSINYPNSTQIYSNTPMNNLGGGVWYYNFCMGNLTGEYKVSGIANPNGLQDTFNYNFIITLSGNEPLGDTGKTILLIIFIIIIIGMTSSLLYFIFRTLELKYDAKDLILSVSIYFGLLCYYYFVYYYLNNLFVYEFTGKLLIIGGVTHIILAIASFILSYVKNATNKRNIVEGLE